MQWLQTPSAWTAHQTEKKNFRILSWLRDWFISDIVPKFKNKNEKVSCQLFPSFFDLLWHRVLFKKKTKETQTNGSRSFRQILQLFYERKKEKKIFGLIKATVSPFFSPILFLELIQFLFVLEIVQTGGHIVSTLNPRFSCFKIISNRFLFPLKEVKALYENKKIFCLNLQFLKFSYIFSPYFAHK